MFDLGQSMSAIFYILGHVEGPVNYKKVLKLLYMADRESLFESGWTITEDEPIVMPKGPVLNNLYTLLTDENAPNRDIFTTFFNIENGNVSIKKPFTYNWLSQFTEGVLNNVCNQYGNKTWQELSEMTHKLPEWGKKTLSWEQIIEDNNRQDVLPLYKDSVSSLDSDLDRDEILAYA